MTVTNAPASSVVSNSGAIPNNYQDGTTLDNCSIGATTPAAGRFTTLSITGGGGAVATTAATLSLTSALHAGRVVVQDAASGCAIALPAATGTGDKYTIAVKTTISSVGLVISCTPLTDKFQGMAWVMSDNSQAVLAYLPASTDNTLTMNGTTQGGYAGALIELRDIALGIWEVNTFSKATGSEATPFSHV